MTINERRQELHQIKNAPDGPNKIFAIYNRLMAREGIPGEPGRMNNGQIEAILEIEYPEGEANRHDLGLPASTRWMAIEAASIVLHHVCSSAHQRGFLVH